MRLYPVKQLIQLALVLFSLSFLFGCISAKQAPHPTNNEALVNVFTANDMNAAEVSRGVVVYLPSLMFMFDSAEITTDSVDKIKFIATVSNTENVANRDISIEGHTDSKGSESYNMRLSEQRAIAVSKALFAHGLARNRTQTKWFGETAPLMPDTLSDGSDNPEGLAANRRVEVIFLNN